MSDFPTQLFINGELRPAANGKTIDLTNPATGEMFSEAAAATTGDVDGAVAGAHGAFVQSWRDLSPRQRTDVLFAVAQAIDRLFATPKIIPTLSFSINFPLINFHNVLCRSFLR